MYFRRFELQKKLGALGKSPKIAFSTFFLPKFAKSSVPKFPESFPAQSAGKKILGFLGGPGHPPSPKGWSGPPPLPDHHSLNTLGGGGTHEVLDRKNKRLGFHWVGNAEFVAKMATESQLSGSTFPPFAALAPAPFCGQGRPPANRSCDSFPRDNPQIYPKLEEEGEVEVEEPRGHPIFQIF